MSEITLTATGPVGSGKSALLGEIEVTLRALNIPYRHQDEVSALAEKNLTGADWIGELERTKPTVLLVDQNASNGIVATARRLALEEAAKVCDESMRAATALSDQYTRGERVPGILDVALAVASSHISARLAVAIREKAKA